MFTFCFCYQIFGERSFSAPHKDNQDSLQSLRTGKQSKFKLGGDLNSEVGKI